MRVFLIRHAKAEKRADWDGPDALRPLSAAGLAQAESIASAMRGARVDRILSSPMRRCLQTVAPLGRAAGAAIEAVDWLAKGESASKAADAIVAMGDWRIVCATHAELVRHLAAELQERGVRVERVSRPSDEATTDSEARRLAVLDLGSTSFHMLVADVTRGGRLTAVDRERVMLRLGAAIASHDHIPDDVAERAVSAAVRLKERAESIGAEEVLAVGTAALRDADNGPVLTRRLARATGVPVRILSGEEEARIMFESFRRRVRLPSGVVVGLDLGGGSLEIALGDRDRVLFETTLPIGAARLHRHFVTRDPMRRRELHALCDHVTAELEPWRERITAYGPVGAVAAGGTARALGHLAVGLRGMRPAGTINEMILDRDALHEAAAILTQSERQERLALPGMRRRRADLLPTGALILLAVVDRLGLDGLTLTDWGLREGVLLDAIGAA